MITEGETLFVNVSVKNNENEVFFKCKKSRIFLKKNSKKQNGASRGNSSAQLVSSCKQVLLQEEALPHSCSPALPPGVCTDMRSLIINRAALGKVVKHKQTSVDTSVTGERAYEKTKEADVAVVVVVVL